MRKVVVERDRPIDSPADRVRAQVDAIYRSESRRIFATLIRLLGDFDLAEDAIQEAFRAAMEQWPRQGVPANPRPWLVSTGRFKAIDALRRRARSSASLDKIAGLLTLEAGDAGDQDAEEIEDDRLRLIFTCCHPALSAEARVALTLREVCGLTTEAIAHAFLTSPTTLAADRARQGQDPGGAHSLSGAVWGGTPRAPGGRAAGYLPGVQ
jgi:RNA polymerase sigma-70 factor (ECF subfamily)